MPVRIFFVVFCICSLLIVVYRSEQSTDSNSGTSDTGGSNNEPAIIPTREHEKLKKELEVFLKAKPSEFDEQLSKAKELFANKQYEDADLLLQATRLEYPDQPDLLAHHAETIALLNDGSFDGEPFELLSRSLDIDSRHKPSLWMMALVNQNTGNDEAAVILFELLKRETSPDSSSLQMIDAAIAASVVRIEAQAESEAANATDTATATDANAESTVGPVTGNPSLNLYITLEPEMLNIFAPDDVVFVYAQAPDESAMPLAVTRRKVSDFPATVTLDDSMAMMPDQSLSSSNIVTVGARASRSGTAMPFAGDWEVKLYEVPVDTTETIPLNIQYELK